eukprot:CAMPEP_0114576144 /NCGR_PEP_ID=MMETSP0125-20121206/931_1 /TAXON_ID=485358 ORGANISM="Aristerostoma sp., Strain ATCC 50986" /NCGR_SAMPLE_ID=MMETSP0125 /ASSEMBLY_ACC=CAM_ASM_000245 /LENGTH=152 /DNA_ID=CAMNT_0001764415 /DNA_START=517 /DNA_END=975 /DNA_ORIENTATION=+
MLLGEDFRLKICDFDCAYFPKDKALNGRGTRNFRAPETRSELVYKPTASDVYSAGIILFALRYKILPYVEDRETKGYDLYELLKEQSPEFWKAHKEFQSNFEYSEEFKDLFFAMCSMDPDKRPTIKDIKKSKWYNGKVYAQKELNYQMAFRY